MTSKRRSRRRSSLTKGVIFLVLGIATVLILILISLNTQQSPAAIIDSNKYFVISNATALASYGTSTNTTIIIKSLSFDFTPIGGDAHFVEVRDQMMSQTESLYVWEVIPNGTSTTLDEILISGAGIFSVKQPEGYPVKMKIDSREARGWVNFFIPEDNVYITPTQRG